MSYQQAWYSSMSATLRRRVGVGLNSRAFSRSGLDRTDAGSAGSMVMVSLVREERIWWAL